MQRLAAVHDAPAAVVASSYAAHPLRPLESDVADPQFTRDPVKAHLPGIAEAEGEDLAASPGDGEQRIIGRNRVGTRSVAAADVDAEDRGEQIGHVLAGL